jgi:transposase
VIVQGTSVGLDVHALSVVAHAVDEETGKSYSTSGPSLRTRWAKVEPALRARGHAGNRRLNKRWHSFTERGKNPRVANVAVARELAGRCWSLSTIQ